MNVPFVARSTHEAVCQERDRLAALLEQRTSELDAARACADGALEKVVELAKIMATPAPIVTNGLSTPTFTEFPPIVAAALATVTAGLPRDLVRQQYARAEAMLAEKKPADEVARLIRQGEMIPVAMGEPE